MKTKQIFILLQTIALFGIVKVDAQIVYHDFDPDEVLSVSPESFEFVYFDIDGDTQMDMRFMCSNYPSFNLWNVGIQQIDEENPKIEILIDDLIPPGQIGYYVKALVQNDEISEDFQFSSGYPQLGDVYNEHLRGQGEKYIGFRLKYDGDNYKYGWFLVELSGTSNITLVIKKLAYNNTFNQPINAGQTTVGLDSPEYAGIEYHIYPNPANDYFVIDLSDYNAYSELRIFSPDGKLIYHFNNIDFPKTVDISDLNSGNYLVEIIGQDGSRTQKLLMKY